MLMGRGQPLYATKRLLLLVGTQQLAVWVWTRRDKYLQDFSILMQQRQELWKKSRIDEVGFVWKSSIVDTLKTSESIKSNVAEQRTTWWRNE